jgi:hypothetical protein
VLVGGDAHAEVNVRRAELGLTGRADRPDDGTFLHGSASPDGE